MGKKETKIFNLNSETSCYDLSEPEKELMLAVLKSAVSDVAKGDKISIARAKRFFLNQNDDYIFSFISICELLSVSPDKVIVEAGLVNDSEFMRSYGKQYQMF